MAASTLTPDDTLGIACKYAGDPPFTSAHNVLLFAFNFSDQQYDRPLMNRLPDEPVMEVREGLSGMDGAAQAGFIMGRLLDLPALYQYILFAQYAPQTISCECGRPCCRRHKDNRLWLATIDKISMAALTQALPGCLSHRVLRDGIVKKLFERKATKNKIILADLAERCGVPNRTALDQSAKVRRWFYGTKEGKNAEQGQRDIAESMIEASFKACGLI